MKKEVNLSWDIFIRYSILIIAGILNVQLFYFFFSELTVFPIHFLLSLFFDVERTANVLMIGNLPIEIIGSCIAGSAYYLLLILNLSTPKIEIKKRILALLFSFALLLVVNITRIFLLSLMLISGSVFFDVVHKLIWIAGSVVFVVAIWFLTVKVFKIKEIPFYSDLMTLFNHSKQRKKTKGRKKH